MTNKPTFVVHAENRNREKAEEFLSGAIPEDWEAWISHVDVHGANVCVRIPQRDLPAGFLKYVGEYGDLRIEGTDGEAVETVVQL